MSGAETYESRFSGVVRRWFYRSRGQWVERFDLAFSGAEDEVSEFPGFGKDQEFVDEFAFTGAFKLGPSIAYARRLPATDSDFDPAEYFRGNEHAVAPIAPVSIDVSEAGLLDDDEFWGLLGDMRARGTTAEAQQLLERLAAGGDDLIFRWQNTLSAKLFALDSPFNTVAIRVADDAREVVDPELSMMARCFVIVSGRDAFDDFLARPRGLTWVQAMLGANDIYSDVASAAYERLHNGVRPVFQTALSARTGSNVELWGEPFEYPRDRPLDPTRPPATRADLERYFYFQPPQDAARQDLIWDGAAAIGMRFLIARAIIRRGVERAEVLVWFTSFLDEPDSDRQARICRFLEGADSTTEVIGDLIEIADTRHPRPDRLVIDGFRISRRSRLAREQYAVRYVHP